MAQLIKRNLSALKIIMSLLLLAFLVSSTAATAATNKKRRSRRKYRRKYSSTRIFSGDGKFPRGCRSVGYEFKDDMLVLKPVVEQNAQTLYLIHNKSPQSVKITLKKLPHHVFSPSYKNTITRNAWSAFAMDQEQMNFTCSSASSHSGSHAINCEDVLELCQYTNVKFSENNMGNYWVINSDTKGRTVHGAIGKGILLRW